MRRNPDRLPDIRSTLARPVLHRRNPGRRQNNLRRTFGQRRQRLQAARNLQAPTNASTNENSSQIRRPRARRLSNRSCDKIATIRERDDSLRKLRLI